MGLKCHKDTLKFKEFCQIVPKTKKVLVFMFCVQNYKFCADSQKTHASSHPQLLEALLARCPEHHHLYYQILQSLFLPHPPPDPPGHLSETVLTPQTVSQLWPEAGQQVPGQLAAVCANCHIFSHQSPCLLLDTETLELHHFPAKILKIKNSEYSLVIKF